MQSVTIGCVIKASGVSARFGGNKLLAPLWGKPLICHLLDSLPQALARTVVVTRQEAIAALARERGLHAVLHDFPRVSDTIRLGTAAMMDLDGCMFCGGDQPGLRQDTLRAMLAAFASNPGRIHRLSFGEKPGSPVIFPSFLYPELLSLTGEETGSTVIRRHRELVSLVEAASERELMDVDTREDLALWEGRVQDE